MSYLLDSDVFIQAKNFHYNFAICPGFWDWIEHANKQGAVCSLSKVREELTALEDELSTWVKARCHLFRDCDDGKTLESMKLLSTWVIGHYEPAAQNEFFSGADFPLVAYAHAHGFTVVTHEKLSPGRRVKIPNACGALDVPSMTPFEMLKKHGAQFIFQGKEAEPAQRDLFDGKS